MPRDPCYTTIVASAKLVISAIFCRFHGLLPTIFGPGRISMHCDPGYTTIEASAKLEFSAIFLPFSWVITHDLWSREDFDAL